MDKRSLFYWSREYVKDLYMGQNYRQLHKVITINIINFRFLPNRDYHTSFHLREDKDKTILTDVLEIHFIDMVKWRKEGKIDIVNNPMDRWLTWFDLYSQPELIEEVVKMDTTIQKAKERQEYVLTDEDTLRLYEMRELAYWDNINAEEYAREVQEKALKVQETALKNQERALKKGLKKGLKEGRKEGMENKEAEVARKMKTLGYSINEITAVTGLSLEALEKLDSKTQNG